MIRLTRIRLLSRPLSHTLSRIITSHHHHHQHSSTTRASRYLSTNTNNNSSTSSSSPASPSFSTLLQLAQSGEPDAAMTLFWSSNRWIPSFCSAALVACSYLNKDAVSQAQRILDGMKQHGMIPSASDYSIYVQLLNQDQQYSRVTKLWETTLHQSTACNTSIPLLSSVMNAYAAQDNAEQLVQIMDQYLTIPPSAVETTATPSADTRIRFSLWCSFMTHMFRLGRHREVAAYGSRLRTGTRSHLIHHAIANPNHPHHQRAKQLLEIIDASTAKVSNKGSGSTSATETERDPQPASHTTITTTPTTTTTTVSKTITRTTPTTITTITTTVTTTTAPNNGTTNTTTSSDAGN